MYSIKYMLVRFVHRMGSFFTDVEVNWSVFIPHTHPRLLTSLKISKRIFVANVILTNKTTTATDNCSEIGTWDHPNHPTAWEPWFSHSSHQIQRIVLPLLSVVVHFRLAVQKTRVLSFFLSGHQVSFIWRLVLSYAPQYLTSWNYLWFL